MRTLLGAIATFFGVYFALMVGFRTFLIPVALSIFAISSGIWLIWARSSVRAPRYKVLVYAPLGLIQLLVLGDDLRRLFYILLEIAPV